MTLQTQPRKINLSSRIIAGIIPSHQQRVLKLESQGLRPAAIAAAMGMRPGGSQAVRDVLAHYGIVIPDRLTRAASS